MHDSTQALFPHALLSALRDAPERCAFEHGARRVSRAELLALIGRLAAALRDAGLAPGRAVALYTAVSPEAFAAQIAAYTLGCRVVGVRPGYTERQLTHVLGMQVDAVLVDPSTFCAGAQPRASAPRTPALTPRLLESAGSPALLSLGPCAGAHDLLAQAGDGAPPTDLAQPDDIALLTFTSGSTGQPKACAYSYSALSAHWAWRGPARWSPVAAELAAGFQRSLLFGTLASLVVFEFLALCLLGGGTAVIPELDERPPFPYAIERYRISGSIITVPRLCQMLEVLREQPVDVSSLRALMVSGSPISPRRLAAAADRLGPVVYQGYGQTEIGSISMLTPSDLILTPEPAMRSVGRPHPGIEVSVRDGHEQPLATGQTGEIYLRSPSLMARYWNEPEETRDTLRDGWLRTRDLGYQDEQGWLYLVGRTRDVILVNALVVYAGPIERVLGSHPDVEQAYVTGAPDERGGEAVHAFVVAAPGRTPDPIELAVLVRAELGEDSVPSTITPISDVPLAPSGKPDKRALLALLGPTPA